MDAHALIRERAPLRMFEKIRNVVDMNPPKGGQGDFDLSGLQLQFPSGRSLAALGVLLGPMQSCEDVFKY